MAQHNLKLKKTSRIIRREQERWSVASKNKCHTVHTSKKNNATTGRTALKKEIFIYIYM
jgi:hypothetical protein